MFNMDENINFETALNRLSEIVEKLENGELELDSSLSLFEEGTKLSAFCYKELENAKLKITNLNRKNEE